LSGLAFKTPTFFGLAAETLANIGQPLLSSNYGKSRGISGTIKTRPNTTSRRPKILLGAIRFCSLSGLSTLSAAPLSHGGTGNYLNALFTLFSPPLRIILTPGYFASRLLAQGRLEERLVLPTPPCPQRKKTYLLWMALVASTDTSWNLSPLASCNSPLAPPCFHTPHIFFGNVFMPHIIWHRSFFDRSKGDTKSLSGT
jgi:hypothetical protein